MRRFLIMFCLTLLLSWTTVLLCWVSGWRPTPQTQYMDHIDFNEVELKRKDNFRLRPSEDGDYIVEKLIPVDPRTVIVDPFPTDPEDYEGFLHRDAGKIIGSYTNDAGEINHIRITPGIIELPNGVQNVKLETSVLSFECINGNLRIYHK